MFRKVFVLVSLVLMLSLTGSVSADMIAQESFDYAAGETDLSGGTGWNGAWYHETGKPLTQVEIMTPGLDYPNETAGIGNRAYVSGLGDGTNSKRLLAEEQTLGDTVWMGFIAQADVLPPDDRWSGVSMYDHDPYGEHLFMGAPWGESTWGIDLHGQGKYMSDIPVTQKVFWVARVEFIAANDTLITVWINPDMSTTPDSADALKSKSVTGFDRFDLVRVHGGGGDDLEINYDEIKIGSNYADIIPAGFNLAPQVEAGDYQSFSWTQTHSAQLAATVSDDGKPTDPCEVTLTWSQISGPGSVSFDPCNSVEDPCATFTEAGIYELRLRGYDGEKDACDVVTICVRLNNDPIAYWDFEEGVGTTVDDSANNNDGVFAGITSEPNWVDGWITGATNNKALEFYGNGSHVEIATDGTIDPNLDNLTYEITIASWVNVTATNNQWAGIITRSDSSWRLAMRDQDRKFHFAVGGGSGSCCINGEIEVGLDEWHHVAGVYDGLELRLYVNGVLDVSGAHTDGIALTDYPVWLGANSEHPDDTSTFDGKIDDTRIYGYALSAAQIRELVDMGMGTMPTVDAGSNETFYMQNGSHQLDGTLIDDSPPTATLKWTQESGPGTAVFSNDMIEDPTVTFSETFPELEDYVLRLTANDVLGSVFDEVTITVKNPTCADVISDKLLISADISGPEGDPDCRVDLYDFAEFAGNWLRCNDPQDSECEFPY